MRQEDDWQPILKGQSEHYEKAKSRRRLRSYKTIEISNFLVKCDETVPPDQQFSLLPLLARQLDKRTKFEHFLTNYTSGPSRRWSAAGGKSDEPTAVLSGVITYYRHGNRLRRAIIGWGQGDTRIHCLLRVTDKATDEVLLERLEKGSASGISGSSKAMKTLASNIAKAMAKNW